MVKNTYFSEWNERQPTSRLSKRSIDPSVDCVACDPPPVDSARPSPDQFEKRLAWFLDDAPGDACATAGKGAYRYRIIHVYDMSRA